MRILEGSKHYTQIIAEDTLYKVVKVGNPEKELAFIKFQDGWSRSVGINGVHSEDLLLIVKDRINFLQRGVFICEEHEKVLEYLDAILTALSTRKKPILR